MKKMKGLAWLSFIVFAFALVAQSSAQAGDNGYGGDPSCTIYADPSTIEYNGGTTLTWDTSDDVINATLHPTGSSSWGQDVPVDGSWWICGIVDTRSYSLTVENEDGNTATCDVLITVEAEEEDPACEMYADPSTIVPGGGTTLIWESSDNAVNAVLHPTGSTDWMQDVPVDGSWWITGITDSRSYSLTVETAGGRTATCNAPIIVEEVSEAPTCDIYADPDTIAAGGGTTLVWESSDNVVSAKLHPTGSTGYFADVTPDGSWWICGIANSRSYSVTVETADGQTATCDAPIVVE